MYSYKRACIRTYYIYHLFKFVLSERVYVLHLYITKALLYLQICMYYNYAQILAHRLRALQYIKIYIIGCKCSLCIVLLLFFSSRSFSFSWSVSRLCFVFPSPSHNAFKVFAGMGMGHGIGDCAMWV